MGMGNALAPEERVTGASAFSKARHLFSPRRRPRPRAHSGVASDCGTTLSTADSQPEHARGSVSSLRSAVRRLSSARRSRSNGNALAPTTEEDETSKSAHSATSSGSRRSASASANAEPDEAAVRARRIHEAEKILAEVAKEYAAKRAAGLVPSKPVPARTLLWQELERRARTGLGRRGQCIFGRDSDAGPCGCTSYKKLKKLPDGRENTGGVCECCGHGGVWHRLTGGSMAASSVSAGLSTSRSSVRSSMRARARSGGARSRASSGNSQSAALEASGSVYSLGSDYYDDYDYDSDYDSDEDEDDEEIAMEMARPYGMIMQDPAPPLTRRSTGGSTRESCRHSHSRSEGDAAALALDRSSLFSNGDSFGLPPRLSSTSRHLDKLLGAIAKYREQGLTEDEIEQRIRQDFPPTEQRASYVEDKAEGGAVRASR